MQTLSRSSAVRNDADSSNTFVRVDIKVASVDGAPRGKYLFRLTNDGKTKSTTAKHLTGVRGSAFSEKLRLYSKVDSRGLMVDDASGPTLSLIRVDASGEVPVSTVPVKLRDLLQRRSPTIALGDGMVATLNLSVKEMGGGSSATLSALASSSSTHGDDFSDLNIPSSASPAPKFSKKMGDAVTKGGQKQTPSSEREDIAVDEVRALKIKVERLEVERKRLQKERTEAVKKVQAHVAHAAKIKTTYNQLAAMYNSLRQEHVELRKSHSLISGASSKDTPGTSVAVEDRKGAFLEEENERLKQELQLIKSEKEELVGQGKGFSEAKARTLADLEVKWRETQDDLKSTKASLKAEKDANESMRKELESVKSTAGDIKGLQADLERIKREKSELESRHREQISQINRDVADRSLQISQLQIAADNAFREQENSDLELEKVKASLEEAVRTLRAQEDLHAEELSKKHAELEAVRAEAQRSAQSVSSRDAVYSELEAKNEQLEQDLEMARKQADDIGQALHHARAELVEKEELLERSDRIGHDDSSSKWRSSEAEWQGQIERLKEERDNTIRELFRVRKTLSREIRTLKKKANQVGEQADGHLAGDAAATEALSTRLSTLISENEMLKSQLAGAERENMEYKSQVDSITARAAEDDEELRAKLLEIERALDSERTKVKSLTATMSKLREQDDYAKRELKELSDARSQKEKELNAERLRLEKELEDRHGSSIQLEKEKSQLSASITDLESELVTLRSSERKMAAEAESSRKLLRNKKAQLESQNSELSELRLKVSTLMQQNEDSTRSLKTLKESAGTQAANLNTELSDLKARFIEAQEEVVALKEAKDSTDIRYSVLQETAEQWKEEKEKKDIEVSRLAAELSSLKNSLNQASETSTTVEKQLTDAQAKLAERNAAVSARTVELASLSEKLAATQGTLEETTSKLQMETRKANDVERLEKLLQSSKDSLAEEKKLRIAKESQLIEYQSSLDALRSESKTLHAKVVALSGQLHSEHQYRQEAEEERKRLETALGESDEHHRNLDIDLMESKRTVEKERSENASLKAGLEKKSLDLTERQREVEKLKKTIKSNEQERAEGVSKLELELETLRQSARESEAKRANLEGRCRSLELSSQEAGDLRERLASKENEFAKLTKLLGGLKDENERALNDYEILREQNRNMKRQLESVEDISRSVEEERDRMTSDSQNVRRELDRVIGEKEVLAATVEELQRSLARDEKDRRKTTELRKELRAARGRAEMLEADVANIKAENRELSSRAQAAKALEDANGEMEGIVEDLVKAKLQLAEAHEENDALKFRLNKLEAISHAKDGSSSFERRGSSSFERTSSAEKRKRRLRR